MLCPQARTLLLLPLLSPPPPARFDLVLWSIQPFYSLIHFAMREKNQPSKQQMGRLLLVSALNQVREGPRITRAGAGKHHRPGVVSTWQAEPTLHLLFFPSVEWGSGGKTIFHLCFQV